VLPFETERFNPYLCNNCCCKNCEEKGLFFELLKDLEGEKQEENPAVK